MTLDSLNKGDKRKFVDCTVEIFMDLLLCTKGQTESRGKQKSWHAKYWNIAYDWNNFYVQKVTVQ